MEETYDNGEVSFKDIDETIKPEFEELMKEILITEFNSFWKLRYQALKNFIIDSVLGTI